MPAKTAPRGEYIETVRTPHHPTPLSPLTLQETGNKISRRATILGPKHIILAGKCVIQHDVLVHGDLVTPRAHSSSTSSTSKTAADGKAAPPAETVSIHLGRYVFVSNNVTLHPPSRLSTSPSTGQQSLMYHPLRISDHVFIGSNAHIRAATIGSHVYIGANCVVGNLCIIKDNVRVEDGAVLPANSMWASGRVVAGSPARVVGEVGEAWGLFEGGAGVGDVALVGSRERWVSVGNRK